jgi:hypothetical protein
MKQRAAHQPHQKTKPVPAKEPLQSLLLMTAIKQQSLKQVPEILATNLQITQIQKTTILPIIQIQHQIKRQIKMEQVMFPKQIMTEQKQ